LKPPVGKINETEWDRDAVNFQTLATSARPSFGPCGC
jgi:hypothetical protein